MADMLATPADLASLLQQDVDTATATLVLEASTAAVQAACGPIPQRLIQVLGDTLTVLGTTESWLDLPQRPVTAVTSVTLDGQLLTAVTAGGSATGYRLIGNRLWRTAGWQTYCGEPSTAVIECDHGYPAGHQRLQLAKGAVLSISKAMYANPSGVASEAIDDYRVSFARAEAEAAATLDAAPFLGRSLRKQYGPRADLARLG